MRHTLRQFGGRSFKRTGRLSRQFGLAQKVAPRAFAGQRLDPAHTGRDRAFRQDGEKSDIAEAMDMGAAAQFDRIGFGRGRVVTHGEDAHLITIFFAEQGFGTGLDRIVRRHQPRGDIGILTDDGIHLLLDLLQFLVAQWLWMTEIEAQAVRRNQ